MGRLVNRESRSSVPQPQSVDSLPYRSPPSPSLFSAIPTSRGLFPVPLLPTPARPNSSSRRVRRSHSDRRLMTAMANRAVRAINTLHFNYPSSRYACALSFRSHESDPSPAQRRLQQSLLSASARLVQSCRQLGSVTASSSLTAGQSAATVQLLPGRLDSASTAPRASPLLTALTSYDHSDPSAASLFYTTKDVTPSFPISSSLPVWGSSSHPTTGSQTSPLTLSRAFDAFDALHTRSAVGPPGGYDAATGIVLLVADRVALPNSLHHVGLLSYLPSAITATYSAPHQLLLPAGQAQQRLSDAHLLSPRVLGDRDQYILLVKRMVELQMLEFTTTPCCVNGLFGVPKGDEEIRLILMPGQPTAFSWILLMCISLHHLICLSC